MVGNVAIVSINKQSIVSLYLIAIKPCTPEKEKVCTGNVCTRLPGNCVAVEKLKDNYSGFSW